MKRTWQVSEAKQKLSLLLRDAQNNPQTIENRGSKTAVVVSAKLFESMQAAEEASSPQARIRKFLVASERLSAIAGDAFVETSRRSRPSPFGDDTE